MIPNVVKGGDMRGVVRYLVGPGRANEHTNPHVIGGDAHLVHWHGAEVLDLAAAGEISDYLEQPRKVFGTPMTARVKAFDPESGELTTVGHRDEHVWHCSLSMPPGERVISDEEWSTITSEFMDEMGFTEQSGRAPARWVAIHHGTSAGGNDHVHIAASMVREDGTKWEGRYGDFKAAQKACRMMEARHGLVGVAGPEAGLSPRGEKPAERAQADRAGMANVAPDELAHRVRAAATASTSEAEWIRRVRRDGIVIKPRWERGSSTVAAGYKVALKPESYNGKLVFYGGGRLGKDLTLTRLREGFGEPSAEDSRAASAEWVAASRGQRPVVTDGREAGQVADEASVKAAQMLGREVDRLAAVPIHDETQWAQAAQDTAGVLSAWAKFDPEHRDDLHRVAAQVARSAQVRRPAGSPRRPRSHASTMGAAMVLLHTRTGGRGKVAGVLLAKQVVAMVTALHDRHVAVHHLREAELLRTRALGRLQAIPLTGYGSAESAPAAAREFRVAAEQGRAAAQFDMSAGQPMPTTPLPNKLTPKAPAPAKTKSSDREPGYEK